MHNHCLQVETFLFLFFCTNYLFSNLLTIRIIILNPFAPELPVQIHVLSTPRDIISFNGQGQLCPLTCAE